MKKLTGEEINACKELGENHAEDNVDRLIACAINNRLSSDQVIAQDDDWEAYAYCATSILVNKGFIDEPSGFGYGHEKLLAFKVFTEAYQRKITALIKDRYKVFLQVPFSEKNTVKALGAKWDATSQRWYVPEGVYAEPFSKWVEPLPPSLADTANRVRIYGRTQDSMWLPYATLLKFHN
jgi:hypothetical protein